MLQRQELHLNPEDRSMLKNMNDMLMDIKARLDAKSSPVIQHAPSSSKPKQKQPVTLECQVLISCIRCNHLLSIEVS